MPEFLSLSMAQINPKVGDIEGNLKRIKDFWEKADSQSHMVIFPELSLSGYPPEDLLLRLDFIQKCHKALEELLDFSIKRESLAVIGMPYYNGDLYNALVLLGGGEGAWYIQKDLFTKLLRL